MQDFFHQQYFAKDFSFFWKLAYMFNFLSLTPLFRAMIDMIVPTVLSGEKLARSIWCRWVFVSQQFGKQTWKDHESTRSILEDGQESIFRLSFCCSLSVKCIDSSLKESSVMRSHIADQTMRMCQRLNDLTPKMVQYLFCTCCEVMCYVRQ